MNTKQLSPFQATPILRIGVAFLLPVSVLTSALTMNGCGDSNAPAAASHASAESSDTLVEYTVRGRVNQLPGGAEHPAREFMVRHEAIPEYRYTMAPGDDRMGMTSMAMAFPLSDGVSIENIRVGDPIEMMFETTYDGETGRLKGYIIKRLTPLDPGTALEIAETRPSSP